MSDEGWTLDELVERAAQTLAETGVRAPNGRVTALPDRRVVRWYATIGLLDRPLRTGGRVARYGERHLLQLVAVKRRQAEGRSLAEIQAELTGATDATLRQVTGLAGIAHQPATDLPDGDRAGFWRERAAAPTAATTFPARPLSLVPLHPAAALQLHAAPTDDDLAAIHQAAQPLLAELAARGLLPPEGNLQ